MTEETGPVLDQMNVVVRDMDPMVAFYRRLGLTIDDAPAPWDRHHRTAQATGGLDLDLDSHAFATTWNQGLPGQHTGPIIGFRLPTRDAVDRTYVDLTGAGYTGQQPPYDAFWGTRYALVEDPDGNPVGLMSPVDPERRSRPPTPPA